MDSFRLPLFPEGSLSASVITTVFVGVWIVCFFNLRLGWTFSGLVVPGYLAPLLIAKPWAGAVVCAEALTTYLVVWLLSERLSRWGLWCSFFGRDRFFALVLGSIAVRLLADVVFLPLAGAWANATFGIEFDYHNNLHSYGLIVVALLANQLWKPGLTRGVGTAAVTIGLTYVVVRFGLMEFTNFNVGNLQYMYEDIAASLLASPKAYIILVTTAFLASRMNLQYSWEFNGILIPALLALQWYEPIKILMSVVEAGAIYLLACLVLRLPVLRNQSFEGARKLLLFFTLGFAWKMALGFLLPHGWPGIRVTDYYGFGYMLSTLLALKAHDKGIVVRMASATFQISLVGAAAGSLIGFALVMAPRPWVGAAAPEITQEEEPPPERLSDAIEREIVARYEALGKAAPPLPDASQRNAFANGLRDLLAYARTQAPARLRQAQMHLGAVGYRVDVVEDRYLCVSEGRARRGWGFYVLDLHGPDGVAVEVPDPAGEWATTEAGLALFRELGGRALALAGGRGSRDDWGDILRQPRSLFQTFHEVAAARNVVQVRATPDEKSGLWVKAALPGGLDLAQLRQMVGGVEIHWKPAAGGNAQARSSRTEFAELFLSRADRRTLLAASIERQPDRPDGKLERASGRIRPWLLASRARIADAGTNLYVPPTQQELLLFADEVLTPLLGTLKRWRASDEDRCDLEAVAAAAAVFRYRLIWHSDPAGPGDYLILTESERLPRRHWGTFVFRAGGGPFAIQTPRPIFEQNSLEYGVLLFDRLRASAILVAGAHPEANQNRRADVLNPRNKLNLFSLVGQLVLREAGDDPLMMVQSRAFGVRPTGVVTQADALLATSDGATTRSGLSRLGKEVLGALEKDRLNVRLADGSPEAMGYDASAAPLSSYLAQTRNKELALVWLSPLARPLYRQQADNRIQEAQFRAVEIESVQADLYEHLAGMKVRGGSGPVPEALRQTVERYLAAQDVVVLHEMKTRWPRVRFTRLIDESTQQAFLLIESTPGRPPLVANLSGRPGGKGEETKRVLPPASFTAAEVSKYVDARLTWLELGEKP